MPATFGQQLKEAREQLGLSIEDAVHETRIPAARIRMLESGNFAGFGSMTYARSFIRSYSEYLGLDASRILNELPVGALGGEHDYRYLTRSHGTWIRSRDAVHERISEPGSRRVRTIQSPLPAAIMVFILILAGTAMWGKHVADLQMKAAPSEWQTAPTRSGLAEGVPSTNAEPLPAIASKPRQIDFPVMVRKQAPMD